MAHVLLDEIKHIFLTVGVAKLSQRALDGMEVGHGWGSEQNEHGAGHFVIGKDF
jgi:hypothetical protein